MNVSRNIFRAESTSWFSWRYRLLQGEHCFARLELAAVAPRATAWIDGTAFTMERESMFEGRFLADAPDGRVFSAVKPSAMQRRMEVTVDGRWLLLEAPSMWHRKLVLRDNGVEIGTVRPTGIISRTAIIDFPTDLDIRAQVFIAWLALYLWKRINEGS